MRKIIALLLIAVLLLGLVGCVQTADTAAFYYTRYEDSYLYGQENAVIAAEYRDITGHAGDLKYLLTLYFHGPTMEALHSPVPSGMGLRSVKQVGDTLFIELSSSLTMLGGTDLTLACACLAQTCFGLSNAQAVSITAEGLGIVSMTLTRDSLLLVDDTPIPEQ